VVEKEKEKEKNNHAPLSLSLSLSLPLSITTITLHPTIPRTSHLAILAILSVISLFTVMVVFQNNLLSAYEKLGEVLDEAMQGGVCEGLGVWSLNYWVFRRTEGI
jgi:hypothetical protein